MSARGISQNFKINEASFGAANSLNSNSNSNYWLEVTFNQRERAETWAL